MPANRHKKLERNDAAIHAFAWTLAGRKGRKYLLEGLSRLIWTCWFGGPENTWKDEGRQQTEDSWPIRDLLERNG
jgi:hypothetical protein